MIVQLDIKHLIVCPAARERAPRMMRQMDMPRTPYFAALHNIALLDEAVLHLSHHPKDLSPHFA